ncbi:hypothetical protein [Roseburia sp. 1XD42-69]|uniref:hypothetical protein n=1 Tax=Roseburia sp. 1XD42-69 TaxID=2320088 RepID=UPI000EA2449C|nr:hypothetical protein [Roseburia sp. 1XD42-69]RKJ67066.1 hypothetical protein D7Y06_05740 [Roseburia sp. 1XD42-69]
MTLQMHYQEKYEEGLEQGAEREKVEIAKRMLVDGNLPEDKIALFSGLGLERVLELKNEFELV